MSSFSYNDYALSILIFSPLLAAAVAALLKNETAIRRWTLVSTTAIALFSIPLYIRFDLTKAGFQYLQTVKWIPAFKINYALGIWHQLAARFVDHLYHAPCALASWRYIQTRQGIHDLPSDHETAMVEYSVP
jgi:NADH-quinone oxidoreductase subunit M